jgi:hypothetical protein
VYGGVMIGSSILRNSDKMFLDSYARCNLRMFSCKKTRARANTYFQKFEVCITVTRKFPFNSYGRMKTLMWNFHYLGYYCSPNLSIHQNSTQEPTWNFLVTLVCIGIILCFQNS